MQGPEDSPFEGGIFQLELFLPDNYPMQPPKVKKKKKNFKFF